MSPLLIIADVEILYHSDLSFTERIYGPLDVDVCRIKLHEPLSRIVQQPLLYVRDMVPKACFEALIKLGEVGRFTLSGNEGKGRYFCFDICIHLNRLV